MIWIFKFSIFSSIRLLIFSYSRLRRFLCWPIYSWQDSSSFSWSGRNGSSFLFLYNFIEFITLKIYGGVSAEKKWKRIKERAHRQKGDNCDFIVVDAHKILDKLLEGLVPTYQADSFSTRLAYIGKGTFSGVEEIWWAHELYLSVTRNEVVEVGRENVERLIGAYDRAFKDLDLQA